MKKRYYFIVFVLTFIFIPKNTYALTPSQYANRHMCPKFELAGAHTDGIADKVGCYNTYNDAKRAMTSNGASDLIIFDETGSTTRIVDAQYGLVDFTLTSNSLIYFYESSSLNTRQYMAINPHGYGADDGAFIEINPTNYAAKVKVVNFTGWIGKNDYVIVPLNWVKGSASYSITNDSIRHNYNSSSGRTIGPKPEMLGTGTYYSYDGIYFYKNRMDMIKDYKKGNNNSAVNKSNPYYNYYMYLSNHTKTTYSSINIDEYTRKVLGYSYDSYSDKAKSSASSLYGKGLYFYNSQQIHGINAILSYSLSRNETGNGTSNLSINKHNGFGLNAVDSSPTQSATYYATFAASIYGYASKWNNYGYSYATDWRYFGPAFGDKQNGMNVKYATDAYWSEKMAANYYSFDKYYGLNDYNYYQLGIVKKATNAYFNPNEAKKIYVYPEANDQLVIVGETDNHYKVMSDMNIDSNGNLVGSSSDYNKGYNWNTNYVYVRKSDVLKINKGKYGYTNPNSVTSYIDSEYTYDLYVENTVLKPKVATLNNDTNYYYDSSLTSKTGKKVLKDKLVMVYSAAYNKNREVVAYLITSDYMNDQKHWVSASSIRFINSDYGKQVLDSAGYYEWVVSEPIDDAKYKIGGQYTNSYFPIVSSTTKNGVLWYKIPVSLDSNTNSYGYILAKEPIAHIETCKHQVKNNNPVIVASDKEIMQGTSFNVMSNVKATDPEDGDITSKIKVTSNNVNTSIPGVYQVTYSVTDKENATVTKTIKVVVKENSKPTITADDIEIKIGSTFNAMSNVKALDKEDGDITSKIKITSNNVNTKVVGTYKVVYEVTDSNGGKTTKERIVSVVKDSEPVITASDKTISLNSNFNELSGISATDREDGDITKNIKVIENTVNTKVVGDYKVTYQVTDSYGNKVVKTINIKVAEIILEEKPGRFELEYLKESSNKLIIKGYSTIDGINNDLNTDISYKILFENINNGTVYKQDLNRISNNSDIPYSVPSNDKKNYKYAWFSGEITVDKIPDGDYKMYIEASNDKYFSKTIVSNQLYSEQVKTYSTKSKYLLTRNNYFSTHRDLELVIRSNKLANKTTNALANQYGQYEDIKFINNKLYLYGNSFSSGMDLSSSNKVKRQIIFENTSTYKTYSYKLENAEKKLYEVKLPVSDKLSKENAWYEGQIDISNLEVGEYSIYINTISNLEDIGELNEQLFRDLSTIKATINNKKYQFNVNYKKRYRVELKVTK